MHKAFVKKIAALLAVITMLFSFDALYISADASEYTSNPLSQNVYLSDYSLTLSMGEKSLLHVYSSSNSGLQNSADFISSDTSVVKVDGVGNITAVGTGSAEVTVKVKGSGKTAVCKVNVKEQEMTTVPETQPTTTVPPSTAPPATEPATQPPTTQPVSYPVTLSSTTGTMYTGNYYQVIAICRGKLTWTSSDTNVATVSDGIITGKAAGTAMIKAASQTHSVQFKITVKKPTNSVNILKKSISIDRYKTFFLSSSTSGVKWKSSNTSVATVSNGYVLAKNTGKAVISAYTSNGEATCLVTVTGAAPIRFVYTSPNSATLNGNVTFVAITDTAKTAVKFEVSVNGKTISFNASSKTTDSDVLVWKGTQKMTSAGEFKVTAYSQENNNSWQTCADGEATVFVTKVTDKSVTSCEKRRASNELISLIADYEGFRPDAIGDDITGDPTLGHGVLVFPGETFYNDLTKSEAYAHLVTSVNNDGYTSKVNQFLINNNIKFNQYQYDALVCFAYNLGYGVLFDDDELKGALLNCYESQQGAVKPAAGVAGFVNAEYVNFRTGPSLNNSVIETMDINTQFTFVDATLYNNEWYKIKRTDGTVGYIYYEYASVKSSVRNLNYVNKDALIKAFLQYHHAAGDCYWGLLYRRVDEMEIFFYHDYERDGRDNKYNISFTCYNNPSFSI